MVAAFDAVTGDPTVMIHPVMQQMLGTVNDIIEERSDGMIGLLCPDGYLRYFPPAVQVVPEQVAPTAIIAPEEHVPRSDIAVGADEVVHRGASPPPPPPALLSDPSLEIEAQMQ